MLKTKFTFGILALFASLALAEITLRVFWHPPSLDEKYARNDYPWLKGNVVLNSMNWRDKEYDPDNKSGNYRIVVLGDSYTFGWYINDVNKTFPRQLEKNLEERFQGRSFDVINASRHGFSPAEELARLRNEVIWFHPNLIIDAIDFGDFHHTTKTIFNPPDFLFKSYFYQATVVKLIEIWQSETELKNYKNGFSETSPEFATVTKNLLEMKHVADENGAQFAILIFPELNPASPNSAYLHENYHVGVKRFAQENGVLVIDPWESFLGVRDRSKLVINPADAHPSELAHELIAESIMTQYDFSRDLEVFKPISPKIKMAMVQKIGDRLDGFRHVRDIRVTGGSQYPAVYFERKNGLDVESRPPLSLKDRKLAFLEDKFKTVKSYTHPGWPGAVIEYNLEPNGNEIILSNLYEFPVLGIKQFTAYWRDEDKKSEVAEWLLPESVSLKNGELVINIKPKKNYFLYRVEVLVGVEQIDINEDGEIADITKTQELETTLGGDSNKVTLDTDGKIGSHPTFLSSEGSSPWVFVDNVMALAKSAVIEDGKFTLQFNKVIEKGSKVSIPVSIRPDRRSSFIVEYE